VAWHVGIAQAGADHLQDGREIARAMPWPAGPTTSAATTVPVTVPEVEAGQAAFHAAAEEKLTPPFTRAGRSGRARRAAGGELLVGELELDARVVSRTRASKMALPAAKMAGTSCVPTRAARSAFPHQRRRRTRCKQKCV